MLSFFSRGALSLAVVSLLSASAAAEVFSKLASVPEGKFWEKPPRIKSKGKARRNRLTE
jgi:tripeptidyl-peptidase-1